MEAIVNKIFGIIVYVICIGGALKALQMSDTVLKGAGAMAEKVKNGVRQRAEGNPNLENSRQNRYRYNLNSKYNAGRARASDAIGAQSKRMGNRGFRARVLQGVGKAVNYGNIEAERAAQNKKQEEIIASQYAQGGDSSIRALWAREYKGTEEEGPANNRQVGHYYGYADAGGNYKEWAATDVQKARTLVGGDPSRLQSYAKYEMKKASDDGTMDDFQARLIDTMNDYGYDAGTANAVWGGVKFANQDLRKERKYQNIGGTKGNLTWTGVDHAGMSTELTDGMVKGNYVSFRQSTANAAIEGYNAAARRLEANEYTDESERSKDVFTTENYKRLGSHLGTSIYYGQPGGGTPDPEALRRATEMAARAGATTPGGDQQGPSGYGLGSSANAELAWKDFVDLTTGRAAYGEVKARQASRLTSARDAPEFARTGRTS